MAAERSQTFLLLAVLVLSIFADPCESQELRCQCIQTHSSFIPPKFISEVQLIPEGTSCSRKEIIVTLKSGKSVCLDPEAEWVKTIIKKILDSSRNETPSGICKLIVGAGVMRTVPLIDGQHKEHHVPWISGALAFIVSLDILQNFL